MIARLSISYKDSKSTKKTKETTSVQRFEGHWLLLVAPDMWLEHYLKVKQEWPRVC